MKLNPVINRTQLAQAFETHSGIKIPRDYNKDSTRIFIHCTNQCYVLRVRN